MSEKFALEAAVKVALSSGDVKMASELLGHLYSLTGTVISGSRLGRTLGFPTANLEIVNEEMLLPAFGVYAVFVKIDSGLFRAVSNIGTRPTVDGNLIAFEVHLLRYCGDLYGKKAEVFFLDRIRNERRFSNTGELISQIRRDIETAEALFANWNKTNSNSINPLCF